MERKFSRLTSHGFVSLVTAEGITMTKWMCCLYELTVKPKAFSDGIMSA